MNTEWFRGLSGKEKTSRQAEVLGFDSAWKLLDLVLSKKLKESRSFPDYKNAAWPYEQAHLNGRKEMLEEIITMLKE